MAKTTKTQLDTERLRISTDVMRALAHPLRLQILALLHTRTTANVQAIYTGLGIEQSVASQHLRVLRQADLVSTDRQGKNVFYLLNEERLARAGQVAEQLAAFVGRK